MKLHSHRFLAASALAALGLTLIGCQQAPPAVSTAATATPAPATTTIVEEVPRRHDDGDARKMQDRRDHSRPDDPDKRDRP